jgi:hypothetical protein
MGWLRNGWFSHILEDIRKGERPEKIKKERLWGQRKDWSLNIH